MVPNRRRRPLPGMTCSSYDIHFSLLSSLFHRLFKSPWKKLHRTILSAFHICVVTLFIILFPTSCSLCSPQTKMPIIHGKPRRWHQRRRLHEGRFQSPDRKPETDKIANLKGSEAQNGVGSAAQSITRSTRQMHNAGTQQKPPLTAIDGRSAVVTVSTSPALNINTISSPVVKSFSEAGTSSEIDSDSESDPDSEIEYGSAAAKDKPEFYRRFIAKCEQEGQTMANRGESARKMICTEESNWTR